MCVWVCAQIFWWFIDGENVYLKRVDFLWLVYCVFEFYSIHEFYTKLSESSSNAKVHRLKPIVGGK